jgi:phosphatidate cytidylyltransferase
MVIALGLLNATGTGPLGLAMFFAFVAWRATGELARALAGCGLELHLAATRGLVVAALLLAGWGGMAVAGPFLSMATPLLLLAVTLRGPIARQTAGRLMSSAGVVCYVAIPLCLLVSLRHDANGFALVIWTLLVVACADVAGMFGGMLFGRTPLAPSISPSKTVEGALAGASSAVGVAILLRFSLPGAWFPAEVGMATCLSLAGLGGDLLASSLKRAAGIKDFSDALPGHGGYMDRLDSLLLAALPAVALAPMMLN